MVPGLALSFVCALAASSRDAGFLPFVLPWDDATAGPTDLSGWLHQPAGAFGAVHVREDGHLYVGDSRIRFLGVNLCFGGAFPEKSAAEKIAARMAKFGVNCVRFHHMDGRAFPDGIRARDVRHTRALDPEALDRLDYLIAELKRRGIYTNLNLLVSRPFSAADDLPPEIEQLDWKDRHAVGFFYTPLFELQKEYAQQLLTHANPYTGTTYAEEPAVAFVEINNENGLLHAWLGGRVERFPAVFRDDLRRQWNGWLTARYGDTSGIRRAWHAEDAAPGVELLDNPDFAAGSHSWTLERHEGADAVVTFAHDGPDGGNAARIEVRRPGEAAWHIQWNQRGLALEPDKTYTLIFRAKAAQERTISASIGQAHEPWRGLGFTADIPLTTDWRSFRHVFRLDRGDVNARLNFTGLGAEQGSVWLADVSLQPGGASGLAEGEFAGTVDVFTRTRFQWSTRAAQGDWVDFLWETERAYWRGLYSYLRDELGVRAPILGTIVACSTPNLMADLDVVDTHAYWQHPRFPGRPWDPENWTVENVSMVNTPGGVLAGLAMQRVVGKPILCTEYNHPAPNTFSSEAPLLLAAFAALQDWDGVFLFAYSHRRDAWNMRRIPNFFDIDQHPLKMANLPIAAAMFFRGDVAPATEWVVADLTAEEERDLIRRSGRAWRVADAQSKGASRNVSLLHRFGIVTDGKRPTPSVAAPEVSDAAVFVSDTDELVWDVQEPDAGVVTVNTARTKAVIGFVRAREFRLGDVTIAPGHTRQDWCTVGITLLEGEAFTGPGRALLVATGDAENTNMGWKGAEKNSVGRDWGEPPSLVESVSVRVLLPVPASRVEVWALDERGGRAGRLAVADEDGRACVEVGTDSRTLWYEVVLRQ
jgi:hypothetical protein